MCTKLMVGFFVIIAVILGLLVNFLSPDHIEYIVPISKFFDAMLPVLAVGALLKYLCGCNKCPKCDMFVDKK
jgi:hypothetical protein